MKKTNRLTYVRPLLIFAVSFAVIGVALHVLLSAAGRNTVIEAEAGTLSGAVAVADNAASGGNYIEFHESPAVFPSRLKTNGRMLVDANGQAMKVLKGFNVQTDQNFVWPASHFADMANAGATVNRAVVFWDTFEPSQGVINNNYVTSLDAHIARAQAAGMYTIIDLHLNVGRYPAWASAYSSELEKYTHFGQKITQFLAYRYGNPASPQYTPAVIGFGLNEPPLDDSAIRNGNNAIPYLESVQRQMISWFRAAGFAPDWIGFIGFGYGAATPLFDRSFQNPNAVNADPHAYDSVGGNVVVDFHDYFVGITGPTATNPSAQARQWNGMIFPDYQGGPMVVPDSASHPNYTSTATVRSQLGLYFEPYITFSSQANVPLMIGEWGWVLTASGLSSWLTDHTAVWLTSKSVIQMVWDYNVTTDANNDPWAARSGGNWRPEILNWLSS